MPDILNQEEIKNNEDIQTDTSKEDLGINNLDNDDVLKQVDIHTMPSKFIPSEQEGSSKKKLLIIMASLLAGFIILGIGAFAAFKFYLNKNSKVNSFLSNLAWNNSSNSTSNSNASSNTSNNNTVNENNNPSEATSTNKIVNNSVENTNEIYLPDNGQIDTPTTTEEVITATSTIDNTTATSSENVIATTTSENLGTSGTSTLKVLDSDKDGLTDVEEIIFSSDKLNADSDGDGFIDGLEVVNLYNPASYAPVKLKDKSDIIAVYDGGKYSLLYPKVWKADILEEGKILFKANEEEFFELIISENPDGISASEWYKIQMNDLNYNSNDLEEIINKNGLKGIKIGENVVYLNDYNYIYVLNYNSGAADEKSFLSVFRMVWESLESKIDTDGDAISDYKEKDIYKTDPKLMDTDGDGQNDGDEIMKGTDPLHS